MKCPACGEVELVIVDRDGITVDRCPNCRGVWLDRGELDKIVRQSREDLSREHEHEESRERAVERAGRHGAERREHLASNRRDSTRLVERLFDF